MPETELHSLILLDQSVIERCSTTREEFDGWLSLLIKSLGPGGVTAAQQNFSLSHVSHIGRCALILKTLSGLEGFGSIIGRIRREPSFSLYEPRGEWFHLHVAHLLHALGEKDLKLEQVVHGGPKDIWLRNGNILIECKSFDIVPTFNRLLSNQGPVLPPQDDGHTFTHRFRVLGPFGVSPPIGVNEDSRFFGKAMADKYRQMVPGRCNIVAFNPDPFANDARRLRAPVLNMLQEQDTAYELISAFLVVGRGAESAETCRSRVFWFDVDLICNPQAAIRVPQDLVERLEGRGTIVFDEGR